MSDAGRKDISTKAAEKVTPQTSKPTADKVAEKTTGVADKVAQTTAPSSEKSTTQAAADKVSNVKDAHTGPHTPGHLGDKLKETFHMHKHDEHKKL